MMYKSLDNYLEENTKNAYSIIKNSNLSDEEKEEVLCTLDFLKYKIKDNEKVLDCLEKSQNMIIDKEQKDLIMKNFMSFLNNDFIENTEIGKELSEKGYINKQPYLFKYRKEN